jgi:hypothetical protein
MARWRAPCLCFRGRTQFGQVTDSMCRAVAVKRAHAQPAQAVDLLAIAMHPRAIIGAAEPSRRSSPARG